MSETLLSEEELKKKYSDEVIEQYITYAQTTIDTYREIKNLAYQDNITPAQITSAQADFMRISTELLKMYGQVKIVYQAEKEDFQCWFDEKYIQIRNELNKIELSAQKWASTKEIEAYVRVRYKEEYQKRRRDLNLLEVKVSTLRRATENYKSFSYLLVSMANSSQTEMRVLTMENRMNKSVRTPV